MSGACPLCRRPYWVDGARMSRYCAAEPRSSVGPSADELLDCRTRALLIAALVAPVVEAAEAWQTANRGSAHAIGHDLDLSLDAMRDGMRRLEAK